MGKACTGLYTLYKGLYTFYVRGLNGRDSIVIWAWHAVDSIVMRMGNGTSWNG